MISGQEAGRHRAAEVQAEGVVQDPRVRIQVEGRGGLLGDKEDIRGVRHGQEVRQYGEGDGNEGVHIQHIHCADLRPPAGGRPGEGPLGRSPGVVQQSNVSVRLKYNRFPNGT